MWPLRFHGHTINHYLSFVCRCSAAPTFSCITCHFDHNNDYLYIGRDVDRTSEPITRSQNTLFGYERLRDGERSNSALSQQQQAALARSQISQRLMKLIASNLDEDSNESGASGEQTNSNNIPTGSISSQRGSQSSGDSSAINVSSRSVPMTRSTAYSSPKTYISRLMFGQPMEIQQSVLSPVQPSFNKKAEPKSNLFMHFGWLNDYYQLLTTTTT